MFNFRRQTKKSLTKPIEEDVNDIIARITEDDEKQEEVIEDNSDHGSEDDPTLIN